MQRLLLLIILVSTLFSCKNETSKVKNDKKEIQNELLGYLYTTTNGEGENQVVQLSRFNDGSLGDEKVYLTKGKGGSDHSAPANGDYDAQGNLKIIGDYLLTTNPGDHSISVFNLNKKNGNLTFNSIIGSEGERPVTIDFAPVDETKQEYWVAVGNQWGTPTVLYEGEKLKRYPSDEWLNQDLTKTHETDKNRSIELFKMNMATGKLTFIKTLAEYVRENGGPADVKFSPDGSKIAVSLWGIPHFFAKDPLLKELKPSRIYVYDFNNGEVSNSRYFEEEGLSGAVGFNWHNNSKHIYLTYFNIVNDKADNGIVVLGDTDKKLTKVSNHRTGKAEFIDEACWTAISKDQTRLYVCSYITNEVTTFELNPDGTVAKKVGVERRKDYQPNEDSKDLFISPDNKYIYMLGSFFSYSVNTLEITENGVAYKQQYTLKETKDEVGNPGVYDLVGLDGFDLKK